MERVRTKEMRSLIGYWGRLRGDRAMPGRGELDPLAILPTALPYVFLIEPLWGAEPLDFHFRLVGTGVARMTGRDMTGHRMEEGIYGGYGETVMAPPRLAARESWPHLCYGRFAWRDHGFLSESVYLPMEEHGRVGLLLCGMVGIATERAEREDFVRITEYRWRRIEDQEVTALARERAGIGPLQGSLSDP